LTSLTGKYKGDALAHSYSPLSALAAAEYGNLLCGGSPLAHRQNLPTAIGATVRAGMVRESRLLALRANSQLRNLYFMMLAPMPLARIRLAFLR
jgi:hypothetical protein